MIIDYNPLITALFYFLTRDKKPKTPYYSKKIPKNILETHDEVPVNKKDFPYFKEDYMTLKIYRSKKDGSYCAYYKNLITGEALRSSYSYYKWLAPNVNSDLFHWEYSRAKKSK